MFLFHVVCCWRDVWVFVRDFADVYLYFSSAIIHTTYANTRKYLVLLFVGLNRRLYEMYLQAQIEPNSQGCTIQQQQTPQNADRQQDQQQFDQKLDSSSDTSTLGHHFSTFHSVSKIPIPTMQWLSGIPSKILESWYALTRKHYI